MQLDAILEVTIGLIVTWLILSMATSHIQEMFTEWMNWRANFLEGRLMDMFKRQDVVEQFYDHPLIQSLWTKSPMGKKRKPVNIPNDIFAKAAMDVFLNAGKTGDEIPAETMSIATMKQSFQQSMQHFEENNHALARTIKHLMPRMDDAIADIGEETTKIENSVAKFRKNAEAWFDTTMSQASTKYRKNAQTFAFFLGLILAAAFNVDSIYITGELWRDPTLRQSIVAQSANISPDDGASIAETKAKLAELSLPVGWNVAKTEKASREWPLKISGFIITALAAAQGAPFWFDLLRKVAGVRPQSESRAGNDD